MQPVSVFGAGLGFSSDARATRATYSASVVRWRLESACATGSVLRRGARSDFRRSRNCQRSERGTSCHAGNWWEGGGCLAPVSCAAAGTFTAGLSISKAACSRFARAEVTLAPLPAPPTPSIFIAALIQCSNTNGRVQALPLAVSGARACFRSDKRKVPSPWKVLPFSTQT